MYRDHNCGELNISNVGETVLIAGWVQRIRNLGSMKFIDLRDQFGITQVVISENEELTNIDVIWSSNYTRAKATAKYIANNNNLPINLDSSLSERKLGNLKELGEFMKDKSTRDPSQEQLLDRKFKTSDGESAEDTRQRMTKFFDRILKEYEGKRIAVITHRRFYKILFTKLV